MAGLLSERTNLAVSQPSSEAAPSLQRVCCDVNGFVRFAKRHKCVLGENEERGLLVFSGHEDNLFCRSQMRPFLPQWSSVSAVFVSGI